MGRGRGAGKAGGAFAVLATVALVIAVAATPAWAASITSSGPLTQIGTTTDLNCSVNHTGDASGEWFGGTACGTLVATGGVLYGPANIPAGGSAAPKTAWTPVSQTTGGDGSVGNPFTITTNVTGGPLAVRQVDTYVIGQESYRTDVTVTNTTAASLQAIVYRAGDCFLANSDSGFGRISPGGSGTAVSCIDSVNGAPGTRVEQFLPLTANSHYFEANFDDVWAAVGTRLPLPDTCQCAVDTDNGIALSWAVTLAPGASASFSELTTFSPAGVVPVVTAKTADAGVALPSTADGYTVTFHNANTTAATLDTITDTLPAGFAYVAGSTTGGVSTDPAVAGSTLTWTGPFSVPAAGDLTFHFGVTVSATEGVFTNTATATSGTVTVAPAQATAPIQVALVLPVPVVPREGLPVAAATAALVGAALWVRTRRRSGTV